MYNRYIKESDARYAIMDYIGEQTVSKYASSAECKAARYGAEGAMYAIEDAPTADVAPRAEVDRLQHILDSYALQYGTVKDQREVIDQIRRAIARDIVMGAKATLLDYHSQEGEKYSKSLSKTKKQFDIQTERYRAITDTIKFAIETLNEIEKKYTEE